MVPHSTPRRVAGVLVAAITMVALLTGCRTQDQITAEQLLNADRVANGLQALPNFDKADAKAQAWANHLAATGTGVPEDLSHSYLPDGYTEGSFCLLGENVGMGPTIESIEPAFMASPGHRAHILGSSTHVGTGVAKSETTGYVYVVQEFFTASSSDQCPVAAP